MSPPLVASYDKAIALNPDLALGYANRATLLQELNQKPAALADYDQAIHLNDRDAATHTNRAVLLQQMGRARRCPGRATTEPSRWTLCMPPPGSIAHGAIRR